MHPEEKYILCPAVIRGQIFRCNIKLQWSHLFLETKHDGMTHFES